MASDGGVFSYGDAAFHGSAGNIHLTKPVVGMAVTAGGGGYWLVASDGGVFSYGDAVFYGSMGGKKLNDPVVGMASTPDGRGYWLVASDGGVFAFGDAGFFGSTGALRLAQPVTAMATTPDGNGYRLVAADGGVFAFGTAAFEGSLPGLHVSGGAVALLPTRTTPGYLIVTADGRAVAFGAAPKSATCPTSSATTRATSSAAPWSPGSAVLTRRPAHRAPLVGGGPRWRRLLGHDPRRHSVGFRRRPRRRRQPFDVAPQYGRAQELLGPIIRRPRPPVRGVQDPAPQRRQL